ncbi:CDP-glucose 4,6-dehydratase [Desulfosudis oleivorans Hxd3]|uniref:CDP-glucose 4,6-dehydratase n=2 Tax=Desulfosudis TaxID=2904716 RepID=A8ZT81_DESOH|nr:CDP-glucose 4,6-dehydratase [Desulfosudis oleivorans Hxd3]
MKNLFQNAYHRRRVLVTGHTGFKGSWLSFWLSQMGADVYGYSLAPETRPNHFSLLNPGDETPETDIRDIRQVIDCFQSFQPEIVFHLAAQSLVRRSYREPLDTFAANVMGTANILEACRLTKSVRAVVIVTSDKCYQNNEWEWGYRESDPMGGHDPYSASKGCAELVTAAFRNSFFSTGTGHPALMATARAGNVIGGGDWAEDRLIPDVARAFNKKETMKIRNPHGLRPWQHVLEPLSGYLMLGQRLIEGDRGLADAWNFGPSEEDTLPVITLLKRLKTHWSDLDFDVDQQPDQPHEAGLLRLDSSKARRKLGWQPVWNCDQALERTAAWYQAFYNQATILTGADLAAYIESARSKGLPWAQ